MNLWRLAIGAVLILHGLGHALGVLALAQLGRDGWNPRSWLLSDALGETATRVLDVALWSVGGVLFVAAGLALLQIGIPEAWWKPLALTGAVASLIAIGLFPNALPFLFPNKIGAIAVDVAVLIGLLVADWPSEQLLDG